MLNNHTLAIPQISRQVAFLDSREMASNPVAVFEKYRSQLGPTFEFHFGGVRKSIVSADPEFIQHILKDNHHNYHKSAIQVKRMAEFQGTGLLNSHGDFWTRQRHLLSRGFGHTHLKQLLPLQSRVLAEFMPHFAQAASAGPVDIYQQMVKLTLRLVGKSLFGSGMQDDELEQVAQAISHIQAFIVRQIVQPYLIPWFVISGRKRHFQHIRHAAEGIIRQYVTQRRASHADGNDLLQLIMTTAYKDSDATMHPDQVMIEILQLLVAGNETSSNTLAWIFYLLAQHPQYIELIRAEIASIFAGAAITYSGLQQLECTIRVFQEAVRLYPPFWMIDRVALHDDEFCGLHIPAGVTVIPYIYGVHHNASQWQQPWRFDPNRFTPEVSKSRHHYAHIPFGAGPRICIGQNMAMLQILLILVNIIRDYDFRLAADQPPIEIQPMMILRPSGPINMEFSRVTIGAAC